ncbi:rCG27793, isoform CRA_a [Rattus norvegicus]|uniref:RCG27793, isoform CRA_a n=1 Tax=Rattus norvegicus TaxID=10116 RepID=A6KBZ2_RAT|nr:rCG27793, isoform CRA_a [Rattus norvegicus]
MLSMKASPTATIPATPPCLGPKALGEVELKATLSSRLRLWKLSLPAQASARPCP